MCDDTNESFNEALSRAEAWIEEEHLRRESQALQTYEYPLATTVVPRETHVEANVSIRQSIRVFHSAPLQAGALLALLGMMVTAYVGYLLWPYRGLLVVLLIVLAVLAALIGLLRLAWPLIEKAHTGRVAQRYHTPVPHDDHSYVYGYHGEQEVYRSRR